MHNQKQTNKYIQHRYLIVLLKEENQNQIIQNLLNKRFNNHMDN